MTNPKQIVTIANVAQQLDDIEMEMAPKVEEAIASLDMLNHRLIIVEDQAKKYGLRIVRRKTSRSVPIGYRW